MVEGFGKINKVILRLKSQGYLSLRQIKVGFVLRDGDWKYIFYVRDIREENNADLTIKSGMQPFTTRNAGDEELFHLPTDAIEQHNVSSQPDQQHRMSTYRKAVLQWWKTTGGKPLDSLKDCPATPVLLCNKVVQ